MGLVLGNTVAGVVAVTEAALVAGAEEEVKVKVGTGTVVEGVVEGKMLVVVDDEGPPFEEMS